MLRSLKSLRGYTVLAKDAYIGKVHDFYFHDDSWTIRYLVVDTGHWLPGRRVLVRTVVIGKPNWPAFTFPVSLTREQVETSPETDADKPVSRQHEASLHTHYGWPFYWTEPGKETWPPFVPLSFPPESAKRPNHPAKENEDPHLRSIKEVTGYHIHASDGSLGHVEDFIADETEWVIRYLVVHTGVLTAKKVLISPQWLGEISYPEERVNVSLTQEKILNCPEFFPGAAVNREYEERLYDYYGRPAYWVEREMFVETHRDGGINE